MQDEAKSKEQLMADLRELRRRVDKLEKNPPECKLKEDRLKQVGRRKKLGLTIKKVILLNYSKSLGE